MIQYDKIKLVTIPNYLQKINYERFKSEYDENGVLSYYKYSTNKPFSLTIILKPNKNELILEFTSKILLDGCINLINKNNIYNCFVNINKLNIIELDIDKVIHDGEVLYCDVTKDFAADLIQIKQYIALNIKDRINWRVTMPKRNNNIILENNVTTKRHKKESLFMTKTMNYKGRTIKIF